MRALALVLLLVAPELAVAQQPPHGFNRNAAGKVTDRAQLRGMTASGAGVSTVPEDLCSWLSSAGHMTGNYFCLKGDGTQVSSGAATLSSVGTPVLGTSPVCSNGTDCTPVSAITFDGTGDDYASSAVAGYTGSFSCWAVVRLAGVLNGQRILSQETNLGTTSAWGLFGSTGGTGVCFRVYDSAGAVTNNCTTSATGAGFPTGWTFIMASYQRVGAGTSVMNTYEDDFAVTSTATAPLMNTSVTYPLVVGVRSDGLSSTQSIGAFRFAGCTEKVLDDTARLAMYARVKAALVTGKKGEAMALTRTTARTCTRSDYTFQTVGSGKECRSNGGVSIGPSVTNGLLASETLETGAWLSTGTVSVTANGATSADGNLSLDLVTSTTADGSKYQARTLTSDTVFTVSGWMASDGASDTPSIGIDTTVASAVTGCTCTMEDGSACTAATATTASACYGYATVGATPKRMFVTMTVGSAITAVRPFVSGGQYTVTTGTAYFGGLQVENGLSRNRYVRTEGTTATSNRDVLTGPALDYGTTPSMAATINPGWLVGGTTNQYALNLYSSSTDRWNLYVDPTGAVVCMYTGASSYSVTSTVTVSAGAYTRLSCSYDGAGTMQVCVGGTCKTGAATPVQNGTTTFTPHIGTLGTGGGAELRGWVKDWCFSRSSAGCR